MKNNEREQADTESVECSGINWFLTGKLKGQTGFERAKEMADGVWRRAFVRVKVCGVCRVCVCMTFPVVDLKRNHGGPGACLRSVSRCFQR